MTAAEREAFLNGEISRKDRALDAAVMALDQLSKTGSLRRETREETIKMCQEARNLRIF